MADGTVGNQDRGVDAVCLAAGNDLRTVLLERDAMAAIRRGAVKPRRNRPDAAFGGAPAQFGEGEVRARIFGCRVLAVDGDVRDAKVRVQRGIAGVDRVELCFRVVGRAGSLVARARFVGRRRGDQRDPAAGQRLAQRLKRHVGVVRPFVRCAIPQRLVILASPAQIGDRRIASTVHHLRFLSSTWTRSGRSEMMPSTPMSMSLTIVAGSLTVHGMTTMPSACASASIAGVR